MEETSHSTEWPPEVDAFSDFVMLVVPKLGQETARWKYDVWSEEKRLTIFTLTYRDEMEVVAAVDDCLCLHFTSQPSDPSTYSLTPSFSSGGQKKDPSFIQNLLGKSALTSPLDVQVLLDQLDNDRLREDAVASSEASQDSFADFERQVVPRFGQEIAAWKYDVRRAKEAITIFRLGYKDDVAVMADCLSLQSVANTAHPSTPTFLPVFSSGVKKAQPSFVERVLGKSAVSSAEDVQTILDRLDDPYDTGNMDEEVTVVEEETEPNREERGESVESHDSLEDWAARHEEDSGEEDFGASNHDEEDEAEVESRRPLRRSNRTKVVSPEKLPMKPRVKKRSIDEEKGVPVGLKKLKTRKQVDGGGEVEDDVLAEMSAKSTLKLNMDDMPSLPVHEGCGGTILSSQYWTVAASSREKLNCTADIFVDKKALEGLPNLLGEFEEQLADRVTYAAMLLEHLLGGREAAGRSFTYTSSGTCPIERKELVKIVVDLCDGLLEHMGRSFSVEDTEEVRVEVLSLMKPLTDVAYSDLKGYKQAKFRFPSDLFLREYLKGSSYPDEGKVQVARGFDFYVDEEKLRTMAESYKDKGEKLKVVQRWGRFGMDIVSEMVGGVDIIHKGRLHIKGSTLALIGEDLLDAIYERAKKTFGSEEKLAYKPFRLYVRNMFVKGNWSGVAVGHNTNLMASLLFPSTTVQSVLASVPGALPGPAVLVPEVDDPPAEPGCNYWTSPAPHRTRLSPNSDFYMLTARLAEYQRYVGPERSKNKRVTGTDSKEYTTYLKALVQYAVGGEDVFMKRLLQRRKAKEEGLTMAVLDEALVVAMFEHVEHLYAIPGNNLKTAKRLLYDCLKVLSSRLLQQYDKGETRWYFAELDQRPKPEAVALLEAQEYWRKPAPDRTQLRPGHLVYIRTKVLESIASYYGPGSKEACIKKYTYALMLHMLGGVDVAFHLQASKAFHDGYRTMFLFDDLIAVCLHSDLVFNLMFSITPSDSLIFACIRSSRANSHMLRQQARRAGGRQIRPSHNSGAGTAVLRAALSV